MALITCDKLSLGYEGRELLRDLSFTVNAGDYLCIVGENGSGKTTLMKTILGLRQPMSGSIQFGDGLKQTEIGYLPQQTEVQRDFPASVWEIVLSGCMNSLGLRPFYGRAQKTRAEEALRKLDIEGLRRRCYRELSGGQQQRVLLARALCASERILLLDEPVSGLDPQAAEDMYALLNRLNKDGMTIMMISHDLGQAMNAASHVLQIGKDLFFGTKEEYLKNGFMNPGKGENHD